ncbi:MAG: hypothetical protein NTW05_07655 [Pseudonocardiales bacterium]|nr:hypothetical protein [Pseudonocardiales bacterium]
MPDDDAPDDGIRTALADSAGWGARHARLPGPASARRRSRTRRATALAGAVVLTAAAVAAAVGVVVAGPGTGVLAPPAPAAPPPVSPPAPPAATGVPTTIPDDFDLGTDLPSDPDYTLRTLSAVPADVCPGDGVPGLDAATDLAVEQVTGPEFGDTRALAVFADANAAVGFMTGLQETARACAGGVPRPEGGSREIVLEPLPGPWATGMTLLLVDVQDQSAGPAPLAVGSYLYAVRVGSAVALQYRTGEILLFSRPFAPDPDVVALDRPALDGLAPRLCRWTVAGC